MSTTTFNTVAGHDGAARVARWRSLGWEIRCEFLALLRNLSFSLPTLLFPAMFYLLFAVLMPMGRSGSWHAGQYLLASYTVFGVMGPALFGFGVSVAMDRENGWLRIKRVVPAPAWSYLVAKLVMAMLFAALIYVIMVAMAVGLAGVRMALESWLLLAAVAVLGVLPFCALGLWIGTVSTGRSATAIVNLVYLPMGFLAGLWFPLMMLPGFLQAIAPVWPAYHLGRIGLMAVGQLPVTGLLTHVAVLAAITLVFFALAVRRLSRLA
jgi:ABC-2 type transport system permease protein